MTIDASVPGQFPTQDGVDRSNHIAVILSGGLPRVIEPARYNSTGQPAVVVPDWVLDAIEQTNSQLGIKSRPIDTTAFIYPVGPQAQGPSFEIVTLFESFKSLMEYVESVGTATWLLSFARNMKRTSSKNEHSLPPHIAYTPAALKGMAEGYVIDMYGAQPAGETVLHCLTQEFYDGYLSPAHPSGSVEYLAVIPLDEGNFRIKIKGTSEILELVRERSGVEESLPKLKFLDDFVER